MSKEDCKDFLEGFRSKDISFCKGKEGCIAAINLDEKLAGDAVTKDAIITLKAIENSDTSLCEKIQIKEPPGLIQACQAIIIGNLNICQQCEGVLRFRDDYCNWLGRKIEEQYYKKEIQRLGGAYEKKREFGEEEP